MWNSFSLLNFTFLKLIKFCIFCTKAVAEEKKRIASSCVKLCTGMSRAFNWKRSEIQFKIDTSSEVLPTLLKIQLLYCTEFSVVDSWNHFLLGMCHTGFLKVGSREKIFGVKNRVWEQSFTFVTRLCAWMMNKVNELDREGGEHVMQLKLTKCEILLAYWISHFWNLSNFAFFALKQLLKKKKKRIASSWWSSVQESQTILIGKGVRYIQDWHFKSSCRLY